MKITLLLALAGLLLATQARAQLEDHYEENPIEIQEGTTLDDDKVVRLDVGEKVTFAIRVIEREFFGHSVISANARMTNTTDQEVKAIYSISFHDKEGKLVGCYQCTWDMDPKKEINFGSAQIYATPEEIATVTSYKLRTQVLESKDK